MKLKELVYYLLEHSDQMAADTDIVIGFDDGSETKYIDLGRQFSYGTGISGGERVKPLFVLYGQDATEEIKKRIK
jgi:hypothetical protein